MKCDPFYGCQNGDCYAERTYPANELLVYNDTVWCEGCLENEHGYEAMEKATSFVPELVAENAKLKKVLETIAEAGLEPIDPAYRRLAREALDG
jgi:hypothetical protein